MSTYGTVVEADTYHADRGNVTWATYSGADKLAALVRGSQYIDQRYRKKLCSGRWISLFPGEKTDGRSQPREWPRKNAVDYEGLTLVNDEVPVEVKYAAFEAALREAASPGSLSPDFVFSGYVTQVTIGPITEKYALASDFSDNLPNRPIIPMIDELIAPVLWHEPYCGPGVRVV
jgi:hypothetical protein